MLAPSLLQAQSGLSISAMNVDFGTVNAGQEVTQSLTVTNTTSSNLYVTAELPDAALTNFDESNNCSFTDSHANETFLAGGASCTVSVTFTPAISGVLTTQLTVSTHSGYNTITPVFIIPLSGVSLGGDRLAASPNPINCDQSSSFRPGRAHTDLVYNSGVRYNYGPTYKVTIGNPTTSPLPVPGVLDRSAVPDFLVSNACPAVLMPNDTCFVYVVYMPRTVRSTSQEQLSIGAAANSVSLSMIGHLSFGPLPVQANIVNVLSGKALDVEGASRADGAKIQQWAANDSLQQMWSVNLLQDMPIRTYLDGKMLDVTGASFADGAPVQQWTPNGFPQQVWRFVPSGDSYIIQNVLTSKVLDVTGASTANGARVQQWTSNGAQQQLWQLLAVPSPSIISSALPGGKGPDSGGISVSNGTAVQLSAGSRNWYFVPVDGGYFKIRSALTGKVLDVKDASLADGAIVQWWDDNGGWQQHWRLEPIGLDQYAISEDVPYLKLVNRLSGKVLDITGGSTQNGTVLQQWSDLGNIQQRWQIF